MPTSPFDPSNTKANEPQPKPHHGAKVKHHAAAANDWVSTNPAENIALMPTFDAAAHALNNLNIEVAGYWVKRQGDTNIPSSELRQNQYLNSVPVNIHMDLMVADDLEVKDINAATWFAGLKDALADSDYDTLQAYLTKSLKGFTPNEMKNIQKYWDDNELTIEDAAGEVLAGLG